MNRQAQYSENHLASLSNKSAFSRYTGTKIYQLSNRGESADLTSQIHYKFNVPKRQENQKVSKSTVGVNRVKPTPFETFVFLLLEEEKRKFSPHMKLLRRFRSADVAYSIQSDGVMKILSENDLVVNGQDEILYHNSLLKTLRNSTKADSTTLISASQNSPFFRYRIVRSDGTNLMGHDQQIVRDIADGISKSGTKRALVMQQLYANGFRLQFTEITKQKLSISLARMDSFAPKIFAELLVEHYRSNLTVSLRELVIRVAKGHAIPELLALGRNDNEVIHSLLYKVRCILLHFASSATTDHIWDGKDKTEGGVLIVKKGESVVLLERCTRDTVGDYLVKNTCLETSAFHTFELHEDADELYLDLPLLVRFIV
jgi:hypothetical protein